MRSRWSSAWVFRFHVLSSVALLTYPLARSLACATDCNTQHTGNTTTTTTDATGLALVCPVRYRYSVFACGWLAIRFDTANSSIHSLGLLPLLPLAGVVIQSLPLAGFGRLERLSVP